MASGWPGDGISFEGSAIGVDEGGVAGQGGDVATGGTDRGDKGGGSGAPAIAMAGTVSTVTPSAVVAASAVGRRVASVPMAKGDGANRS